MHWFWLNHRSTDTASIDVEQVPHGGWVGPQARIHPNAKLTPPFLIGAKAEIGASCEIGPNAIVGAGSILDRDVQVAEAVVLPDTYLGQNTRLHRAVAQGGILVDVKRGCRVDIRESFIIAPVSTHRQSASILERLSALTMWIALAPMARLWPRQSWDRREICDSMGDLVTLETGRQGPLLIRRWPWLKQIAIGSFRWFGILPRQPEDWAHVPLETAERLKSSPVGVFSWADLHGCHDVSAPDEWIHAAYQALQKDDTARQILRRKLLSLARLTPQD